MNNLKYGAKRTSFTGLFLILCTAVLLVFSTSLFAEDGHTAAKAKEDEQLLVLHKHEESLSESAGRQNIVSCSQRQSILPLPPATLRMGNPLPPSDKNILAGQTLFLYDASPTPCQVCHDASTHGLGVSYKPLPPTPRNFACFENLKDVSDGQLFWIIQNGTKDTKMPAYRGLEEDQIWQLILYIRHFMN